MRGVYGVRVCRDGGRWRDLREGGGGLAGAGAPDVYVVASGARGHLDTRDVSLLYDAASPRGGTPVGSGESVWSTRNRGDVSRYPEASRGVVDVCAGPRRRTDQ